MDLEIPPQSTEQPGISAADVHGEQRLAALGREKEPCCGLTPAGRQAGTTQALAHSCHQDGGEIRRVKVRKRDKDSLIGKKKKQTNKKPPPPPPHPPQNEAN